MNKVLWTLFYIVATSALAYYLIKEKKIEKKRKEKSVKRINDRLTKWNLFMGTERDFVVKIIDGVISLAYVVVLVLFIQKFYIGNFTVPTPSMEPTVKVKERFFGNMLTPKFKTPDRDSIVIFKEPVTDKLRYTKRLVALPGEEISIDGKGALLINGKQLDNKREYSHLGAMGYNTWTVPKKGDTIKVEEGVFSYYSEALSFKDLQTRLNNGLSEEQGIRGKRLDFTVNGKKYNDGLFSAIQDPEEQFRLLAGETLVKNGNTFKITGGEFYITQDGLSLAEARKILEEDKGAKLDMTSGNFILNNTTPTGPISDREIFTQLILGKEITLEDDYFFMLGDNTNNSSDSRVWGFVKEDRILGTLIFRYWPLSEMGVMVGK